MLLEAVANTTASSFEVIVSELTAMCTTVLQNRLALDYILAKEGGICKLIAFTFLMATVAYFTALLKYDKLYIIIRMVLFLPLGLLMMEAFSMYFPKYFLV